MSQQLAKLDRDNPFLGLRPFSEREQDYFKGRKAEIDGLLRRIKREVLTVLFGISGLGKTSLLRAGLFPLARAEGYFPILIRLSFGPETDSGTKQIKAFVSEAIKNEAVDAPLPDEDESLWTYFHRVQFWSARNELLTPVLVFDQFEEIFTLGQRSQGVDDLIKELSSLIENRIPVTERQKYAEAEDLPFSIEQQNYRVILSLREDFLADLESLQPRIPSLSINRMRLLPMSGVASLQVVSQVPELIEADVAEQVVRFVAAADSEIPLSDFEIEPALLSVFCRELNNKRLARGDQQITADLLKGNKEQILHDFYEKSVEHFSDTVRRFIEEEMLTTTGYRNSVALEDALEHQGVTNTVISDLINDRLVRVEERAGVKRIELTHDLLTREIKTSRDQRRSREAEAAAAEARKKAEAKAEEVRQRAEAEAEMARNKLRRSRMVGAVLIFFCAISVILWRNSVTLKKEAISAQKEAISAKDEAVAANVELEKSLKIAYRVSEAVLDLRTLLKDEGTSEFLRPNKGIFERVFNATSEFDDEYVEVLSLDARSLMSNDNPSEETLDQALQIYNKVLVLKPQFKSPAHLEASIGLEKISSHFYRRAKQQFENKDFEAAVRLANKGLLAEPGRPDLAKILESSTLELRGHQREIQDALVAAQTLIQEGKFLLPPEENAKSAFAEVLLLDENNDQARRALELLPDQVNREINQLRDYKNWTGALELAEAARMEFPADARFVAQIGPLKARLKQATDLEKRSADLLETPSLSVEIIDQAATLFNELVNEFPDAALEQQKQWISRLEQEAEIELIDRALFHFGSSSELNKLRERLLEQDRLASLGENTGQLEVVVLPWAKLVEIRDAQDQPVNNPALSGTTPMVVSLPAGNYTLSFRTGNGDAKSVEVEVLAKRSVREIRNFSEIDAGNYFERTNW